MTTAAVVVMELGSEWPAHIADYTDVVGLAGGGEDLLRRTREKLDLIQNRKGGLRVAVLACNGVPGGGAVSPRAQLARTLLHAVAPSIHGRLIVSACDDASHELRRELLSLVEELSDELRGTTAMVELWFTEPARGRASGAREKRPSYMTAARA